MSNVMWSLLIGLFFIGMTDDNRIVPVGESPEQVSLSTLLAHPIRYHKKLVLVRGLVTQPELHLDETQLVINFVFVLKDGSDHLIVFGKHDRTLGTIQIETDARVEVIGVFWKDRFAHNFHFHNNLEALRVTAYPPLTPDTT